MKTINKANRSVIVAGAIATLAVAAMGFAGSAQARDNVYWSVGVGTPGAVVNVGNGYPQPVYVQPQPVYVQPAPVYVQPRPVYVRPRPVYVQPQPVYLAPEPVYYERRHGHHRRHGGYYEQGRRDGYGPGYGQVYYQRDQRGDRRYGRDDD
ncbi:hypothetical protein [Polaromonas naphthalenivorans]|uniref:Uncharacterized protein n=1 Tax=Polaromonas naphthalenivorans (strain CJ2) TaxID=365044 RepID=A1VLY9_POLNA|nr:hypothetical protein [Polaromonas naphthalenivorans]ABM36667.1 conserved hypothetical protein [Polaromonas naphthalenivorans CJ2]